MKNRDLSVTILIILVIFSLGCRGKHRHVGEKEIVETPQELEYTVSEVIEYSIEDAIENNGHLQEFFIYDPLKVQYIYEQRSFEPLWTKQGNWLPQADSLMSIINDAHKLALFPEDYLTGRLNSLHDKTVVDTSTENRLDASLWAETDMLLTAAFIRLTGDLKIGRLMPDSTRMNDTIVTAGFLQQQLNAFPQVPTADYISSLEPKHKGYKDLKEGLESFLHTADFKEYSLVDTSDKVNLNRAVAARLREDSIFVEGNVDDSTDLSQAIKKFQQRKGLKVDGRLSPAVIHEMNDNDLAKFIRIAISMDRFKQMKPLPKNYIWVNIPSYQLDVFESDSSVLTSRVVVGKPETRTPILTSSITDMITYPLWTIPNSIVIKEILPALKRDPNYLARKGYSLQDKDRKPVDAQSIDWSKYEKTIPFLVVQGSGDANALGVLKFNFPNKYAVYLHDTNQRQFFSRNKRALSHGCVRVQQWYPLAEYLLKRDSLNVNQVPKDSLDQWLAVKEKHVIPFRSKIPVFIRYFTCEAKDGQIIFYEDVYDADKTLRQLYFNQKG